MIAVKFISPQLINALGSTLVHSLWQAAIIGVILLVALKLVPKHNAQLKYWLALTALAGMVFWSGLTLKEQLASIGSHEQIAATQVLNLWEISPNLAVAQTYGLSAVNDYTFQTVSKLQPYMPTLVAIWFLGALIFLVRLQGSIIYLHKLRNHQLIAIPANWKWRVQELSYQLGIRQTVEIAESALAQVPMVIGHLKPIILLPVGMLSGLPARDVEAVIAHELAHVKRYDYLINILQTVVESLLFFNPVVWWVSHVIRKQREHCCDDIAVKCCGNHMIYAHALTNLGAWSLKTPAMSMGLFKSKGELFQRVKRLVYPQSGASLKEKWIPALILGLTLTCLTWYSLKIQAQIKTQSPALQTVSANLEGLNLDIADTKIATVWDTVPPPPEVDEEPPVVAEEREWDEDDYYHDFDVVVPDMDFDVVVPDLDVVIPDIDFDVMVAPYLAMPDIPELADVMVDVQTMVDVELPEILMNLDEVTSFSFEDQLSDTTRKKIEEALKSQREALERAKVEQAQALEKARQQLRESLEAERPEDLTEEEWQEAKEQIRRAERSLEHAIEHTERSLDRALRDQERELAMQLRHAREAMRAHKAEAREHLRHAHREQQRVVRELSREHRHMARRMHESKLRHELVEDGLLDSHDADLKLHFKKDNIRINGKQLQSPLKEKYREILDDMYGNGSQGELEFTN